jgi:hypothetical protein
MYNSSFYGLIIVIQFVKKRYNPCNTWVIAIVFRLYESIACQ